MTVTFLCPTGTTVFAQSAYKHIWCIINRICLATQAYIHGCLNYIWWFIFKCLQHQITWKASMWLYASVTQTGCVHVCVYAACEWVAKRERERERECQSNNQWVTSSVSGLMALNPFSFLKSDVIITSLNSAVENKIMQCARKAWPI